MKLSEMKARLAEIPASIEAITEVAASEERELSEQDGNDILALEQEFDGLEKEIARAESIEAAKSRILAAKVDEVVTQEVAAQTLKEKEEAPAMALPAVAKNQKSKHFASNEDAYVSGMSLLAQAGNRKAKDFMAAQSIGTPALGGDTVAEPLAAALIELLESYGVARGECRRIVMSSSTWTVPKLAQHATVSYPAEADPISDSTLQFGQVQLVAQKMAALVKMSSEVSEDSVISMIDTAVRSIAYAMAIEEDKNLFNGVASGINANGIKGDASVADVSVADLASLELENLTAATVASGNPVLGTRPKWYMNSTLYNGVIRDLLNTNGGGNDLASFEAGLRPTLLGHEVVYTNVLAGASAGTGDLVAVFGDLDAACYFGDRRAPSFRVLNELYANTDQIGVQATQRIDIKVANPELLAKITLA